MKMGRFMKGNFHRGSETALGCIEAATRRCYMMADGGTTGTRVSTNDFKDVIDGVVSDIRKYQSEGERRETTKVVFSRYIICFSG